METLSYRPYWTQSSKQWTLEGQSFFYGDKEAPKIDKFPAVIDTGSMNLGVPTKSFQFLSEEWKKRIPSLDCIIDDNFCQVMTPCSEVAKNLTTVGIQLSGQVFELNPDQYLHQAEGQRCQFAIHENQLKGSTGNLMLIGDLLLRHLYQVYDFEHETISLGVNKHS